MSWHLLFKFPTLLGSNSSPLSTNFGKMLVGGCWSFKLITGLYCLKLFSSSKSNYYICDKLVLYFLVGKISFCAEAIEVKCCWELVWVIFIWFYKLWNSYKIKLWLCHLWFSLQGSKLSEFLRRNYYSLWALSIIQNNHYFYILQGIMSQYLNYDSHDRPRQNFFS